MNKKFAFLCLHRSPSQTQDEFEEGFNSLNLLMPNVNHVNATFSVITSDFNTKPSKWWRLDQGNTCGYSQLIK